MKKLAALSLLFFYSSALAAPNSGSTSSPQGGIPSTSGPVAVGNTPGPGGLIPLPTSYTPNGFQDQAADPISGNPADIHGAIAIDAWGPGWAQKPGGLNDDNGSTIYLTYLVSDALSDAVRGDNNVYTINANTPQGSTTITLGTGRIYDNAFCRCNTSPTFPQVNPDGSCVVGAPTSSFTGNNKGEVFIFNHAEQYAFVTVTSIDACGSGTPTIHTLNPVPIPLTYGDTFQFAVDVAHPNAYYHRWLSQIAIAAPWEARYWPHVNLITNGYGENGTTGWTSITTGTATLANVIMPAGALFGTGDTVQVVRGSSVIQTGRTDGDSIRTIAFNTTPGHSYAIRFIARFEIGRAHV